MYKLILLVFLVFSNVLLFVIEEARKTLSAKMDKAVHIQSDPYLVEAITKSRAMRIGFILVSHEPKSLSVAAMSNVHTMLLMRLGEGTQTKAGTNSLMLNRKQKEFYSQLKLGDAICRDQDFPRPFFVHMPKFPFTPKQTTIEEIDQRFKTFCEEINYKPLENLLRPDLKIEIKQDSKAVQKNKEESSLQEKTRQDKKANEAIPDDCILMLHYLANHRFDKYSDVINGCELPPTRGKAAREWLERNKFTIVHKNKIRTGGNQKGMLMELTEKACKRMKAKPLQGKGSFRHKCYQAYVKNWLLQQGKLATIEKNLYSGFLKKAECSYDTFEKCIEYENWHSSGVNGVHACISIADAICVGLVGRKNAGEHTMGHYC